MVNLFLFNLSNYKQADLILFWNPFIISASLNCMGIVLSLMMEKRETFPEKVSIIASLVGGLMEEIC